MPAGRWTPEELTPRLVVSDRDVSISIRCEGCRLIRQVDPWKLGPRLGDMPLQQMRFLCSRCGLYASEIKVDRSFGGTSEPMFVVSLDPRCWDEGHDAAQAKSRARLGRTLTTKRG